MFNNDPVVSDGGSLGPPGRYSDNNSFRWSDIHQRLLADILTTTVSDGRIFTSASWRIFLQLLFQMVEYIHQRLLADILTTTVSDGGRIFTSASWRIF
jgi:hypothetical protein